MSISDRLKLMTQQYGTNSAMMLSKQPSSLDEDDNGVEVINPLQDYMMTATKLISDKEYVNRSLTEKKNLLQAQVDQKQSENEQQSNALWSKISALKYHFEIMEDEHSKAMTDYENQKAYLLQEINNKKSQIVQVKSQQIEPELFIWAQSLEDKLK
ncbi:hypothetical protein SS50377_22243 [Spironucleus salmonicida]|uniref:Uncharacterized protein n=1 Tax=Spironucleus salmonicida TaxID=348837 RepID=V6LCQ7_9EUKA|nr:hypothetical protein SS50377_22243 [Spironucleus salmonicida]|eukprot:EST42265.1 Hypothetical protein SS50377_18565 [Spironucleus salmonicida]